MPAPPSRWTAWGRDQGIVRLGATVERAGWLFGHSWPKPADLDVTQEALTHGLGLRNRSRISSEARLDARLVREEVLPFETLEPTNDQARVATRLCNRVNTQGLWAAHLDAELGGRAMGRSAGLMHEILGGSPLAPRVFGNNAPDSGNAELLAVGIERPATKRDVAVARTVARRRCAGRIR